MRLAKKIILLFLFFPVALLAQSDFEKMKAEEEAYRKKQQQAENKYAADYQAKLDSMHLEYIKYEIEREKEVLEFEGKNLDPRLVEKAQALEAKKPRNTTFFNQNEDRTVLGGLMEIKESLEKSSTNYQTEKPKEEPQLELPKEKEEQPIAEPQKEPHPEPITIADLSTLSIEEKEVIEQEFEANRPIYIPIMQKDYNISSHFNPSRMHPVLKKPRPHKGIDLAAKTETPIYASANGIVEIAQFSKSAGNWVMINHQNGYKTKYFHMTSFVVKPKQTVKAGDLVGYVGSTGYSSGPHLHYEIRQNNTPLDPFKFMVLHFNDED